MSTSYTIKVGYNSAYNKNTVAEKLLEVVNNIQENIHLIHSEVMSFENLDEKNLLDYCKSYEKPVVDLTLKIEGKGEDIEIIQCASGGGISRDYKEACRRAFLRLVMYEMHKNRMEINIFVS